MSENFHENENINEEEVVAEEEITEEEATAEAEEEVTVYDEKGKRKIATFSENTSGEGKKAFVPDTVKNKFNWGAFMLTWIWGLFNYSFVTLVFLILLLLTLISFIKISPITYLFVFIDLVFMIWFGANGNTWAWQNRRYSGIAQFHEIQKKWAIGALIFWVISAAVFYEPVTNFVIKFNEIFAGT